jgi:AbiU2
MAVSTEDKFWQMHELIRTDIAAAVKSNYTYLAILKLKNSEPPIQAKISKFPEFWTTTLFSLQTTFFISFGRLFDKRRHTHSVAKLIEQTIKNRPLFLRPAVRERRRLHSRISGDDPQWLTQFLSKAWEPTAANLESLMSALKPHCDKFGVIYEPIRHKVYAHRSTEDEAAVYSLFSQALIQDVEEILRFLHTLQWVIWELAWNAKRIDLSDFSSFESEVKNIKDETERFIRRLR